MAFFNFKKDEEKKNDEPKVKKLPVKVSREKPVVAPSDVAAQYASVLRGPRVTEKASALAERGVHVFITALSATKRDVSNAVKAFYGVTPEKVRIVPIPEKIIFSRGKFGKKKAGKKAYVYLREGDKIEML